MLVMVQVEKKQDKAAAADAARTLEEEARRRAMESKTQENVNNIPQIPVKEKMLDMEAARAATMRSQVRVHACVRVCHACGCGVHRGPCRVQCCAC